MPLRIEGFIGEDTNTAEHFAAYLADFKGRAEMVINSPGGIATEGAAILAEMQSHGNVHVFIRGVAAPAASLVAMGGKTITMHPASMLMIHDPSGVTVGTAREHRKSAACLDSLAETYASAYSQATGNPVELVAQWMADETWMNADDALFLHFIDQIEKTPEPVAATTFDVTMFRHPPEYLMRQWRDTEQKERTGNAA